MVTNDQTAVLPRQRPLSAGDPRSRRDGWDVDQPTAVMSKITGSAPVAGGLVGEHRALARLSWLLPTITMAVIGLVRTAWPNPRGDELDLWAFARLSWPQAWRLTDELAGVPLPYHLAIWGWARLAGTSDFALRVPSVLAMTVAAGLVAALGTRLAGPRAGFLAGLFFAVLPTTSRYAQEIGPQALTVCLAVLSTVALVRVLDRPGAWRHVGYFGTVALLSVGGTVALTVLIAHAVAVLAMRRRAFFGWLPAALLGLLPVAAMIYRWGLPELRLDFTAPADLPDLVRLPQELFGTALLGGALVGLALVSFSLRRPGIIFTTWALVPPLVLYAAAQFGPVWRAQYLLFTLPGWALLGALALARAPVVRGVLATATVGLLCLPLQVDLRRPDGHGQASAAPAAVIAVESGPGDAVVYGPTPADGQVGRDIVARYVPADRQPKDVLATGAARTGGRLLATECADVARCLADAPRVWLLRTGHPADPLRGLPAAKADPLRSAYLVDRSWTFAGLGLTRFIRRPVGTAAPPAR